MVETNEVEAHYSSAGIVDRILATLGPGEEVTPDTLAPMDHFHGRGVEATRDLAALLKPQPGDHLLDLGCASAGLHAGLLLTSSVGSRVLTSLPTTAPWRTP